MDKKNESKKTVAVIEDNKDLLEILTTKIREEGFDVYGASCGIEFVREMAGRMPDLILLDLMLPGTSGDGVLNAINKMDVLSDVPVIIFSAKEINEIKESAKNVNAVAYMQKNADYKKIIDLIKEHIK